MNDSLPRYRTGVFGANWEKNEVKPLVCSRRRTSRSLHTQKRAEADMTFILCIYSIHTLSGRAYV